MVGTSDSSKGGRSKKDVRIATGKVNKGIQQFQIIRNHMGPVGFLNLHNMKMFALYIALRNGFFMQLQLQVQVKDQHIATTGSVILLMVQKSGDHQLRLVVYLP